MIDGSPHEADDRMTAYGSLLLCQTQSHLDWEAVKNYITYSDINHMNNRELSKSL